MGVALENNLLVLLFVLLVLAALAGLGKLLWKPILHRVWRFFMAWWERDARQEREAREQAACRRDAEQEVKAFLHKDEDGAQTQMRTKGQR